MIIGGGLKKFRGSFFKQMLKIEYNLCSYVTVE